MSNKQRLREIADRLEQHQPTESVLVGFDGFVDEIIHLVDERLDRDRYRRMESMSQYAQRVSGAVGFSANIEMVSQQVKLGGNGPIMADALQILGCRVNYVGALGKESIHPVFSEFAASCDRVISLAEPAQTDALEFTDGKLMMGKMGSLREVNWEVLRGHATEEDLNALLEEIELMACVNWTMIPNLNSILEGLIPLLQQRSRRLRIFIDLADPRKRTREDIREVLLLLGRMQEHSDLILGMNEQESVQVEEVLFHGETESLTGRAARIREKLNLSLAVIHPLRSACVAWDGGEGHIEGPYAATPKLTTGAGDVFNAGFCRALLSGLTPSDALAGGVCASGFYVRNARPATYAEWIQFIRAWADADGGTL